MKPKAIDRVLWGDFDKGKQKGEPTGEKLLFKLLRQHFNPTESAEIAALLIADFGSLGKVFKASAIQLQAALFARLEQSAPNRLAHKTSANGFGTNHFLRDATDSNSTIVAAVEAIENMRSLLFAVTGHAASCEPVLDNFEAVIAHCRAHLAGEPLEQFHVLALDAQYYLLAHECVQVGTVNHVTVYPREVIAIALRQQASSLILVHNHPSGDARPSKQDISMTRHLAAIGKSLGITVADHIIIGASQTFSFRRADILPLHEPHAEMPKTQSQFGPYGNAAGKNGLTGSASLRVLGGGSTL